MRLRTRVSKECVNECAGYWTTGFLFMKFSGAADLVGLSGRSPLPSGSFVAVSKHPWPSRHMPDASSLHCLSPAPRRGASSFASMDIAPLPKPPRDRSFDPARVSNGEFADSFVAAFLALVAGMGSRQRKRKAKDQERHTAMASALVLDLAHRALTKPGEWIAISMQKTDYSPANRRVSFLTEAFIELVNLVASDSEVVEIRRAAPGRGGTGWLTTIRAAPKLLSLVSKHELMLSDIGRDRSLLGDSIRLKSAKVMGKAKRLPVPDNLTTRRLREEMAELNSWLRSADLHWPDDEEVDKVDLSDRFVYRVFNNGSMEDGGRLYGGFWLGRADRLKVCFGERRAVMLDYGQMGVRAAYSFVGAVPPEGDLYRISGFEFNRDGIKRLLNALLASTGERKALPKGTRCLFPPSFKYQRIYNAVARHHHAIAPLFGQAVIFRQMFAESCLLVRILLHLKSHGVVALPVHDGILVSQEHSALAKTTMLRLFKERFGIEGVVEEVSPSGVSLGSTLGNPYVGGIAA